ncbi:MAG: hypothetical protein ACXWUG_23095 [Polyangiales bacterium]
MSLLSGITLGACGGVVVEEQHSNDAASEVNDDPFDGRTAGISIDAGDPYDGFAVGTGTPYDGSAVGTSDAIAELPDDGVEAAYDGGEMGTTDAIPDSPLEVGIGGPLVAPELPHESFA